MRLYLSSYQLGEDPSPFSDLVGSSRRGIVILNALDAGDPERRRSDAARQIAQLASLGLDAIELDLRRLDPETVKAAFAGVGFCWVRGGNVFVLREALARSGADQVIVDALHDDAFVYAGFSAGPCVLAPSLRGLERCDPPADADRAYGGHRFDGLGVLDRAFVPHLDSPGHPETDVLGKVARAYARAGTPFWALRDGQALVIDGNQPPRIVG